MPKSKAAPKGYNTVTTYLTVKNALGVIDFAKKAFGAEVTEKHLQPNGKLMHAEIRIGDTRIMLGEASGQWKAMPAMFYMYVSDCDAIYKKAIKAGAKSVRAPADQFYGDRSGGVQDKAGNQWWVATKKKKLTTAQMKKAAKDAYKDC